MLRRWICAKGQEELLKTDLEERTHLYHTEECGREAAAERTPISASDHIALIAHMYLENPGSRMEPGFSVCVSWRDVSIRTTIRSAKRCGSSSNRVWISTGSVAMQSVSWGKLTENSVAKGQAMPNQPSKSTLEMTDQEHEEFSQRGLAIYEEKLKPLLEPEYNNQFIAIHVDTEDYRIAKSSGAAMRAMRASRSDGGLVMLKIGPEPEWGLAMRLLASRMSSGLP